MVHYMLTIQAQQESPSCWPSKQHVIAQMLTCMTYTRTRTRAHTQCTLSLAEQQELRQQALPQSQADGSNSGGMGQQGQAAFPDLHGGEPIDISQPYARQQFRTIFHSQGVTV
eukprot:1162074-Pelagomonas_calceolata.AAC.11